MVCSQPVIIRSGNGGGSGSSKWALPAKQLQEKAALQMWAQLQVPQPLTALGAARVRSAGQIIKRRRQLFETELTQLGGSGASVLVVRAR